MIRGPSLTLPATQEKLTYMNKTTYDIEVKAVRAEEARSLSFIESRT
jgi:hypothetical protein